MSVILCTAGYDHTIRFWEALSGICSRTVQHPESQVNRLCISPDKRLLAAAGHQDVKLYDVRSTNPTPTLVLKGHTNNVTGVAFQIEGKWIVTSSEDGTVKIWDTKQGTLQRNYAHGAPVNDVVIHPNQGELISCDRAGNIRIWDLGENKCTHQLIPEGDVAVASVTVAADGTMLCAGNNTGNIYVWRMLPNQDLTTLIPVTSFQAHATYITRVLLSPDGRHLATCSADHNARIWAVMDPPSSYVNRGSPDSRDAQLQQQLPTPAGTPQPNGTGGSKQLQPPTATPERGGGAGSPSKKGNSSLPMPPELRPGQERLAFPLEATLGAHQRWVWDCAFSADSAYLVTASSDHYARLWELSTQNIIRQYNGHHRGAVCVALNDYSETR